jgi:polyisoprenoid-binding protein YceI
MGLAIGPMRAMATEYRFDEDQGRVEFQARASLHDFRGRAQRFQGWIDPAKGRGGLVIEASALTTFLGVRDERMYEVCLEVESHPEIVLELHSVRGNLPDFQQERGVGDVMLMGTMTVRGHARSVQVPASFGFQEGRLTLSGRYDLGWADYQIPDPSTWTSTLYPEVQVEFSVTASPDREGPSATMQEEGASGGSSSDPR